MFRACEEWSRCCCCDGAGDEARDGGVEERGDAVGEPLGDVEEPRGEPVRRREWEERRRGRWDILFLWGLFLSRLDKFS